MSTSGDGWLKRSVFKVRVCIACVVLVYRIIDKWWTAWMTLWLTGNQLSTATALLERSEPIRRWINKIGAQATYLSEWRTCTYHLELLYHLELESCAPFSCPINMTMRLTAQYSIVRRFSESALCQPNSGRMTSELLTLETAGKMNRMMLWLMRGKNIIIEL